MNLGIDFPTFVDIHICLPVFVFWLSRKGMRSYHRCLLLGTVNKREGIQNPTLTAKAGQAYPKKILLLNGIFEKMNPLVFAKGYILLYFSFWVSALIKVWSILFAILVFSAPLLGWAAPILWSNNSGVGH